MVVRIIPICAQKQTSW